MTFLGSKVYAIIKNKAIESEVFNMPIKEYKVRTSEDEKVRRILERFSEVVIIGEEEGDEELTPDQKRIEDDIRAYEEAFGASRKAGEDAKELLKIANREEDWRSDDIE